jgi:hypothetical protein
MKKKNFQVGECSCTACRNACQHKPGWFQPQQIKPLAEAMGLTVEELFKQHLQVDYWNGEEDDPATFVLSPRLKDYEGGTMFPANPRGTCHWYEDGKCAIHTLGKPAECQQLGHEGTTAVRARHEATAQTWKSKRHQQTIRELYGGEPQAETWSMLDMLLGGF